MAEQDHWWNKLILPSLEGAYLHQTASRHRYDTIQVGQPNDKTLSRKCRDLTTSCHMAQRLTLCALRPVPSGAPCGRTGRPF
jgi:hypothetical protein